MERQRSNDCFLLKLVLSDFSAGMVKVSKENCRHHDNVEYQVIDIQDIPFGDETFDIVIANMMLYHVPDLHRALTEVRRVLKRVENFIALLMENMVLQNISRHYFLNMGLKTA